MKLDTITPTAMQALAAQQARFRIDGSGPLTGRTITPVTPVATQLVQQAPGTLDAVRGVLQLVEHVAGGAGPSSKVQFRGIAFSADQQGLAANAYQARLDGDAKLRDGLVKLSTARQQGVLDVLAERNVNQTAGALANVTSGWMNLGPVASATMLARAGAPGAVSTSPNQLANTIRTLLHESVHVVDDSPANLPDAAMHGVWEALAEARTMTLPQLQQARTALGMTSGDVPDASLQQALLHRPYAAAEGLLASTMRAGGIAPGSALERQVLHAPANEAVDVLVARVAKASGASSTDARAAIAASFAETMPAAR